MNDSIQFEHEIQGQVHPKRRTTASSQHILRTYANMILHIGVMRESM